jgi:hypothetical protein
MMGKRVFVCADISSAGAGRDEAASLGKYPSHFKQLQIDCLPVQDNIQ